MTLGLLFGNIAITILLLIFTVLIFICSEHYQNGIGAFFWAIVLLTMNYWWGTFNISHYFTALNIVSYLLIGIVYSFIKTIFYGKHLKETSGLKLELNKAYILDELRQNVLRWILMFPISLIYWIFSDLIVQLWDLIYKRINKFYLWLLLLGNKL